MPNPTSGFVLTALMIGSVLTSACSREEADAEASATADPKIVSGEALSRDQVAAAASQIQPEPGQYRATMRVVDFNVPGMADAQAEMMRGMFEQATSTEYCMTKEDAKKGFEDMVRGGQEGDCEFQKFDTSGGQIDASMTCQTPEGPAQMAMAGTVTRNSGDLTMKMQQKSPQMGTVEMTMNVKHERIGDCPV